MPIYLTLIWAVVAVAMVAVAYLGFGGRALFGTRERPERILGRRVQLMDLERGPKGLDPEQPVLPLAVVESYEPGGEYLLRFDAPVVWLGRAETHAKVTARAVGQPVSLAAGIWRRRVWVAGAFGSGEAFLGDCVVSNDSHQPPTLIWRKRE